MKTHLKELWKQDKVAYQKAYHHDWYQQNAETQRERIARRKKEIRKWFRDYKATLRCARCPENHPATLEFHHRNRSSKMRNVAHMVRAGLSTKAILAEIAKCEVLCANCHAKEHWEEWTEEE